MRLRVVETERAMDGPKRGRIDLRPFMDEGSKLSANAFPPARFAPIEVTAFDRKCQAGKDIRAYAIMSGNKHYRT